VEETGDFRALKIADFLTRAQLHRSSCTTSICARSGWKTT
jgi:hypothetical protein